MMLKLSIFSSSDELTGSWPVAAVVVRSPLWIVRIPNLAKVAKAILFSEVSSIGKKKN